MNLCKRRSWCGLTGSSNSGATSHLREVSGVAMRIIRSSSLVLPALLLIEPSVTVFLTKNVGAKCEDETNV